MSTTTELDRLIASAKEAHRLAEQMLATKTETDEALEAVARGVADAGRAAEILARRKQSSDLARQVLALPVGPDGVPIRPTDESLSGRRGMFTAAAAKDLVSAVKTRSAYRTEVDTKAALTTTVLPTSGQFVEPGLYPQAFPLATLFRWEKAPGPSVRYYRLGGATADVVPEGTAKPDSGLTITPVDAVVEKIATTVRFSDEFAEDADFLLSYLQAELRSAVVTKENAEILAAFTASVGHLADTGPAVDIVDLAADNIAAMEALNGAPPSALIVAPDELATIRKVKASTAGMYIVDPLAAAPTTLHGVRVVSTAAVATGTAWLVQGAGVVIFRRGQITAEIGYNADDWNTNQRTMRVEERLAVAVVRPTMITALTLT